MTATQIQYWNLQESKLHNRNTETISQQQADAATLQAQVAEKDLANKAKQADASYLSAKASQLSSKAAMITAKANKRNAATNAKNAKINAKNASTNAKNASTNAKNAATNAYVASTQAKVADAQVADLFARADFTKKQLSNYEKDMLIKYGPDWSDSVIAADYLGNIAMDPNADSSIKKFAETAIKTTKSWIDKPASERTDKQNKKAIQFVQSWNKKIGVGKAYLDDEGRVRFKKNDEKTHNAAKANKTNKKTK